ncbi:hypothetical protein EPN95_03985 [Patescibacteria group bacterium]|nr:MAG: hypothetical protein EPN95_03985 [Patescibacteria group bacterium]
MKKKHIASLKFHTLYSIILAAIFVLVVIFVRNIVFAAAAGFLLLYIIGNGIIHTKKNELTRDTLLEYILISAIVLVVIVGLIF